MNLEEKTRKLREQLLEILGTTNGLPDSDITRLLEKQNIEAVDKIIALFQLQTPQPEAFWNDSQVMSFVNWYIELKNLDSRYELENQFIIDSFKAGDAAEKWKATAAENSLPEGVKPEELGNTYTAESSWSCYRCMQSNIPGTHVTYEETHVGCGGVCH